MNDLEICKRIAEIERINFDVVDDKVIKIRQGKITMHKEYHELDDMMKRLYASGNIFNPLTDDALCFRLMIKYKVEIDYDDKDVSIYEDGDRKYIAISTESFTEKPNNAICVAIIKRG